LEHYRSRLPSSIRAEIPPSGGFLLLAVLTSLGLPLWQAIILGAGLAAFLALPIWLRRQFKRSEHGPGETSVPRAKSEARAQPPIPAVVFVVQQSYVNYTKGKDIPLKLHMMWANEGEEIRLGRLRWIAENVSYQGQRLGQGLAYRFRVPSGPGKEETESEEVTAKCGQQGELWLGLESSVDVGQVKLWKFWHQLGVLVLPLVVRGVTTEIRIRL
jgi:hypothetical protein